MASIWNAGAIGASVGLGSLHLAIILSVVNLISLLSLSYLDNLSSAGETFQDEDGPPRPDG